MLKGKVEVIYMGSFWCVHYGSSNRNIVLVAEDEERERSAVESVGEKGYY